MLTLFVWLFKLKGWKIGESYPEEMKKCVLIAAPHTSNWDFVFALAALHIMGVKVNYLIKKEWAKWPFSILLRKTGGIPIERKKNQRFVDVAIDKYNASERLILMIPAEGTRKRVDKWKSGFYNIALGAKVPVFLGFLDYKYKIAGTGPRLDLTGDRAKDAAALRSFYADKTAKFPKDFNLDAIRFD